MSLRGCPRERGGQDNPENQLLQVAWLYYIINTIHINAEFCPIPHLSPCEHKEIRIDIYLFSSFFFKYSRTDGSIVKLWIGH